MINSINICILCLLALSVPASVTVSVADEKPFPLGIIGLDTSHVSHFTNYMNDPANNTGCKVVAAYPRIASAVRRYYLLLLDDNRKSYTTVTAKKLVPSKWKVPLECVATSLAGRALAEIIKPGVDCYRWKDRTN